MSDTLSTLDQLKSTIVKQFGESAVEQLPDGIQPGTTFDDDLGADSLDMVELVMAIEEDFSIQISDEVFSEVRTVADAVAVIDTAVAQKAR